MITETTSTRFKPYTRQTIFLARQWQWMSADQQEAVQVMSHVLPFRTNQFVLDRLIDWHKVPDDPIFRLTFPQRAMLPAEDYAQLRELVLFKKDEAAIAAMARRIRMRTHPHRPGPATHGLAGLDDAAQRGLRHKYAESLQFFPSSAQTCYARCTCCPRRSRVSTKDAMTLDTRAVAGLVSYLRTHLAVSDVLITGGDPLSMSTDALAACIEPLLAPELAHIRSIRIDTRSLAWWPHRFVSGHDSGDLLRLFERVAASGKRLAVLGHYSHPVELRNEVAQQAVRHIVASGASLRMQGPLLRGVNDDPASWAELWAAGAKLGAVPHHLLVGRDSGPQDYFSVPLARAHEVFQAACRTLPGLEDIVTGPSMSTSAGKVAIDGIVTIQGERVFALQFLAAHNRDWVGRPFYARFDPGATRFDQLLPAFGHSKFFFEAADTGAARQRKVIPVVPAVGRDAHAHDASLELA
ncbi:lysine 2,3-aminomutase [Massilia sp. GCM10023247]|uniref:lysine 2,3-aminomutase n=1 Tax=Massilia sp. GCM10023247 TaxID=3252643 RepID=UPI00361FB4B9